MNIGKHIFPVNLHFTIFLMTPDHNRDPRNLPNHYSMSQLLPRADFSCQELHLEHFVLLIILGHKKMANVVETANEKNDLKSRRPLVISPSVARD